ncbi:MAG: ATP-binding cassette domain-containing protein [Candidatus Methanofastidiosia archaeon]|jgi:ABC-2 type transport system ATP-binding protein
MSENVLVDVKGLTKDFNSFRAVDSIGFDIGSGELFGLLGPNGAGKTTTIRMLTGILTPSEGTAVIGGYDIQDNPLQAKQLMGIVPEMANAYIDLSPFQNLLLIGELYGIKKGVRTRKAHELLELFGLEDKKMQKVRALSKGLKQRVIVAMALMNDAQVLFLDEPTTGLDVESTRLIRDIIQGSKDKGCGILLTTHNIQEADELCDRIAIMNKGKIVAIERPENLKRIVESSISVEVVFLNTVSSVLEFDHVNRVEKKGDKFKLYTDSPGEVIPQVVKYAEGTGNTVLALNTVGPTLEDVFVQLTGGEP